MSTASTADIVETIRRHLLTFQPLGGGPSVVDLIGTSGSSAGSDGHIFIDQAPDDLDEDSIWLILAVQTLGPGPADGGGLRRGTLELTAYAYGRSRTRELEVIIDIVEQAWLNWMHVSDGSIIARPPFGRYTPSFEDAPSPIDREQSQVRILLPFVVNPSYLTQYLNTDA